MNWQHQLCKNPRPNPDIKTLFTDHTCNPPNGAVPPAPVTLPVAAVAKPAVYTQLGAHGVCFLQIQALARIISSRVCLILPNIHIYFLQPFQPTAAAAAASANALAGWMANASSSSVQAAVVTASSIPVPPNQGWHSCNPGL